MRIKEEAFGAHRRELVFPIVSSFSESFPELVSIRTEYQPFQHEYAFQLPIILDSVSTGETILQQQEYGTRRGPKELTLRECYEQTAIEAWAAMLPEVEHLVVSPAPGVTQLDLRHIWRYWPSLVSLQVIYHHMNAVDFNSTVCGLGEAEVEILEEKTVKQLTQSMVVRTSPSITGMTSKFSKLL